MTSIMDAAVKILVDLLDEAFERVAWHGPTLRGSIRGVNAARASWRPSPKRHSIWELAVHAAYWKYAVRQRLGGGKRGSFAYAGSNWFPRPASQNERAWKADVKLLVDEHRRLRAVVSGLHARDLARRVAGRRQTFAYTIRGIAAHDLYHAGQIQLLKRLQGG
jgi:hypothetical protein